MRGVAAIAVGTIIGQACVLASSPFISRLFGPVEIGLFSAFTAVIGLISTTIAFHYELAIPLPKLDRDARIITGFASLIVLSISILVFALTIIDRGHILEKFGIAGLAPARFILPISLLSSGLTIVWTYAAVRRQAQRANALSKALQGIGQTAAQLAAGLGGLGGTGLALGQAFGATLATMPLVSGNQFSFQGTRLRMTFLRAVILIKRYRKFPLAAAPSSLINAAANQVPTLLLAGCFGLKVAGLYGFGVRVLQLPSRLIGEAISQVFFGHAALAIKKSNLSDIAESLFLMLTTGALYTFVPIAIVAQPAFRVIFGDQWVAAGAYAQWLTPWLLVGFIATPMSVLVSVLEKQRVEFMFQIGYLSLIAGALSIGAGIKSSSVAISLLGVGGGIFMVIKLIWLMRIAGCNSARICKAVCREVAICLIWSLPLVFVNLWVSSAGMVCIVGGLWCVSAHLYNYRFRRLYAF